MPTQTYSEVVASNPSYSAKLYAARLPYAIAAPALGGLALILCFFLLPWFSIGITESGYNLPAASALMNVPGTTIAGSGVTIHAFIANSTGSGGHFADGAFAFPLLWALPVLGLIQILLAFFLFKDKMLPFWLSLSIRLSYLLIFILEIIYLFSAFFGAFSPVKSAGASIATYPAAGLWISLLFTTITGIVSLILLPGLAWYWSLAGNDLARGVRISGVQANLASRRSGTSA